MSLTRDLEFIKEEEPSKKSSSEIDLEQRRIFYTRKFKILTNIIQIFRD